MNHGDNRNHQPHQPMNLNVVAMFLAASAATLIRAEELKIRSEGQPLVSFLDYRTATGTETNRFTLVQQPIEVTADRPGFIPQRAMCYIITGPDGKQARIHCLWPPAGDFTVCQDNWGTNWLIWIEKGAILLRDLARTERIESSFMLGRRPDDIVSSRIYADQVITGVPTSVALDGNRPERIELVFHTIQRTATGEIILRAETPRHKHRVTIKGKDDQWAFLVQEHPPSESPSDSFPGE